jgi:ATP-dependent Lhr-like helicase
MAPTRRSTPLAAFHPHVRAWFRDSVGKPSAPQTEGWPVIRRGDHALIVAPTGSGKTLAAFLDGVDRLIARAAEGPLANAVHILYVSPLKALANDVRVNLERPLAAIGERFRAKGEIPPDIRIAVRTGDTPAGERRRMLREAPHILVTTPESLHLLLTSSQQRGLFSALTCVIVDEVHALAGTKRGAHLALTLERLNHVLARDVQRIGLSATVEPAELAAHWLGGLHPDGTPRSVTTVRCRAPRAAELVVRSPVPDLSHVHGTVWPDVYRLVLDTVRSGKTTLVFVNNRGLAERMAAQVNALAHDTLVYPYHGSLDRERRLRLEQSLKSGQLRGLVTTSALELGIDVGSVDQIVQIQSPARVSSALQRLGRAGHRLDEISRAIFVPTHLTDALETLAIVRAARDAEVEALTVPQNALDVLAQILVAATSVESWTADALFTLVRQAWGYQTLPRSGFDEVLAMLAGKYPAEMGAELAPRLEWNRATGELTALPGSRLAAVLNGGTIPDRGTYKAVLTEGGVLGELDEEFVFESRVGDAFRLGASTWRIAAIEHSRVLVTPAPGAAARLPFWHGEYSGRPFTLAARVGALTRALASADRDAERDALAAEYGADRALIDALAEWVGRQRAATGVVPDDRTIVIEQHRDETGARRVVVHAPFGVRVTAPLGLALSQRLREQLSLEVLPMALNEGLMLRMPEASTDVSSASLLRIGSEEAERRLVEEIGASALFGARFRMNAARALVLARSTPGRRIPLWLQRLKAKDLLSAVRAEPSFPILLETYRDVLEDAFDLPSLRQLLATLAQGTRSVHSVTLDKPSPFSVAYTWQFVQDHLYGDDAPRRVTGGGDALGLDLALLGELLGASAPDQRFRHALDEHLARRRGTHPSRQARSADELVLLLSRAGDLTLAEVAARTAPGVAALDALLDSGRALLVRVPIASRTGSPEPAVADTSWRVIPRDELPRWHAAYGDGILASIRSGITRAATEAEVWHTPAEQRRPAAIARAEVMLRFVGLAGPVSAVEVAARYGFREDAARAVLTTREAAGVLVRIADPADRDTPRWCTRRALESAWRRAMVTLRQDVEPVSLASFAARLPAWQGVVAIGDAASADHDAVLQMLSGAVMPAAQVCDEILPARLNAGAITALFAPGRVVWTGVARTPDVFHLDTVRVMPRDAAALWRADTPPSLPAVPSAERVHDLLRERGALWFEELQQQLQIPIEALQGALAALAARGLVTSDGLDGLRAVAAWRGIRRPSRQVTSRRWQRPDRVPPGWAGRWALVHDPHRVESTVRDTGENAEALARILVARYGVLSRETWRRDHPPVAWRDGYRALVRMAFRGELLRGWFVRGLSPVQFASPAFADALRLPRNEPWRLIPGGDPSNVRRLALPDASWSALERPTSRGATLVLAGERVLAAIANAGRSVLLDPEAAGDERDAIARAVGTYAARQAQRGARRDVVLETINDVDAGAHPGAAAFRSAGWRPSGRTLRWPAPVGSAGSP